MKKVIFTILAICLMSQASEAAIGGGATSHRMDNKFGTLLAVGDPFPSVLGINVAYNIFDYLRAQIGYADVEVTTGLTIGAGGISTSTAKATTIGFGVKGMMPGWNLTPTVGLHYAAISFSGDGEFEVGGFTGSGGHMYASIGADWQTTSGFNMSLGYNMSLTESGSALYVGAGWFFDFLN